MARNPFRSPRRQTAWLKVDNAAIAAEQAEINGLERQAEYTGQKVEVTGPGIGVAGLKRIKNG